MEGGWHQVQVMDMESENAQQPGELREIAADDLFQVWHPAIKPVIEVRRRKQVHADEDIHWGDDSAILQDFRHDASDAQIERIFAVGIDGDHRFRGPGCRGDLAPLTTLWIFHRFMIS